MMGYQITLRTAMQETDDDFFSKTKQPNINLKGKNVVWRGDPEGLKAKEHETRTRSVR